MAYRTIKFRQAQLDVLLHKPGGAVDKHLSSVGNKVTRRAQAIAGERLNTRTGRYRASFRSRTIRDAHGLVEKIENTAPYSAFIERGTRPHVIVPRRGRYLVFTTGDGRTIYTRRVHHPGTRAYRVMERALRQTIGRSVRWR